MGRLKTDVIACGNHKADQPSLGVFFKPEFVLELSIGQLVNSSLL
jgi:hypothetical protein